MKPQLWLLAIAAAGAATPAFAAGGGEENIFSGNLGNAVWTLLIFGAVLVVLGKYAWGPLLDALQKREQFIHDSLAEAKRDREEAEKRLEEHTSQLNQARAEATELVEEGRRDAKAVKARIEEEAREESQKILDRAKREIELAKQTAIKELYTSSASLATEMASRILRKELSTAEKEKMIARSLDELDQLDPN
ncbi:MAG: F0F1 ATP synthase subunit B [bacterium]|nr:F0F1 ATP synthase subunit B [bacterium]